MEVLRFPLNWATAFTLMVMMSTSAAAVDVPTKLWRLDCGRFDVAADAFSDSFSYDSKRIKLVGSCYLIQRRGHLRL